MSKIDEQERGGSQRHLLEREPPIKVSNAALAELHSHPSLRLAAFSLSDRIGLKETVPHMRWRLKKHPYLAIVVAPSWFNALMRYFRRAGARKGRAKPQANKIGVIR